MAEPTPTAPTAVPAVTAPTSTLAPGSPTGQVARTAPGTVPGVPETPGATPGTKARGPDGKFLPKEGEPGAAPPLPKRWKLGETEFSDPDELAKHAATLQDGAEAAKAYRGMLEKAYLTQQEAERLQKQLDSDPEGYLRAKKGWDPIEVGKKAFLDELERQRKYAGVPEEFRPQLEEYQKLKADKAKADQELAEIRQQNEDAKQKAEWRSAREELVTALKATWEHTSLPQHPYLMGLAAEEFRAQKLAGMRPNPQLIARAIEDAVGAAQTATDTDERFDAKAYIKKHPKRAEAIRLAALEAAGLPIQGSAPQGRPGQPTPPAVDPVDRFNQVWDARKR